MSAAIEAGIDGIQAIGFSLLDYNWNANFDGVKKYVKKKNSRYRRAFASFARFEIQQISRNDFNMSLIHILRFRRYSM